MGCGHLKHNKHTYRLTDEEGSYLYKIEEVSCADCGQFLGTRRTRVRYVAVGWGHQPEWFPNSDDAKKYGNEHNLSVFEVECHD
jgi:hypothetical protein